MTGFFGTIKYDLLPVDYKEENKTNPFIEYKRVLGGYSSDEKMLVPILNWFSNHKANIKKMQNVNRCFFYNSKSVIAHNITLNINRGVTFIKYPKKKKKEDEHELIFLVPYIMKYYSWSEREYGFYEKFIDLEDRDLHAELDKAFAFDKKECRKLGITRKKIKAKYQKYEKTKGFF